MDRWESNRPKLDPSLALTCANNIDEIGKKIMAVQKDGKTIIGVLGSVDHFGNVFLCSGFERICVGGSKGVYGDVPVGSILVRGDSLALTCEIDEVLENGRMGMKKVGPEEILHLQKEEMIEKEKRDAVLVEGLKSRGIHYKCSNLHLHGSFEDQI